MRGFVVSLLVLMPAVAEAQLTQPKWVFSHQDPAVNEVIEFWLIVPGAPRDSADDASAELISPKHLQVWLRDRREGCMSGPPSPSRTGDSAQADSWRRSGARDTILYGCAKFTTPGTASPIVQVSRRLPLSQAGIVAVASDPISTRRKQVSDTVRSLQTAGLGALFAALGFLLQDIWRRRRDRADKKREFSETLFNKVSAEVWDNEKLVKELVLGIVPEPRALSTGGYNHVLSQPELRAYLASHRSKAFVERLDVLYESFNQFNDAEFGYHNAKTEKKAARLQQVLELAGTVRNGIGTLFAEEER
jgi:hypothetical protein